MDSTSSEPLGPSIHVEDDAELRALTAFALKQAGCEAVPASSGEDALDLIAAADFDGLYCDIELPGQVMAGKLAPPSALSSPAAMDWLVRTLTGTVALTSAV
jgi:CheY-like chemotaxis protein